MKKTSNPAWHRHISGRRTYREVIDAIRYALECGERQATQEFNRALSAGELRRIWPEDDKLSETPAYYEIAEK